MVNKNKSKSATMSSSETEAEIRDPGDFVKEEDEDEKYDDAVVSRKKPPPFVVGTFLTAYNKKFSSTWPSWKRSCQRTSMRDLPCWSMGGRYTTSLCGGR
jgi:hypothetical protein